MKKNCLLTASLILLTSASVFYSCSSAPKRTMERLEITNSAYGRLEVGTQELSRGEYASARNDFEKAYNLALSVDNCDLLAKVCLSKMSFALAVGESNAKDFLEEAKNYAQDAVEREKMLAMCSLYEARLLLLEETETSLSRAARLCADCESEIKKDAQYLAYLYRTRGEILLAQKNYADSIKQFSEAADLHTKERYLSEIALDWYFMARAYSSLNKGTEAVKALENAVKYDRLDENTAGLGADYYALAVVYMNGNAGVADINKAKNYAERSAKIYEAGGFEELASQSRQLTEQGN